METWLKGGLIAGWLALIPLIYCFTTNCSYVNDRFVTPIVTPVFVIGSYIIYLLKINISKESLDKFFSIAIYLSVIFWFLLGAILGWFYRKISPHNYY